MRAIALLATYNEERFIRPCLENLFRQGFLVYLIDNESTDATQTIAGEYLGRGLIGVETLPRFGQYTWSRILERKERLAMELDADWAMHLDADEVRLPPAGFQTIADALRALERDGFNAVNFMEFTFVPTLEAPNHEHAGFLDSMRWYYPFLPTYPHRLNLWKRPAKGLQLVPSGGHCVTFPGLHMYPEPFPMRHYLFLSREHALEKYIRRRYDPKELERGWHRARAALQPSDIRLISERELRPYTSDAALDPSNPLTQHPLFCR